MTFQYRCNCGALFGQVHNNLLRHLDETKHMLACWCGLTYDNKDLLANHQTLKGHRGRAAGQQNTICPTCQQVFRSKGERKHHQKNLGHCYCKTHAISFGNSEDFIRHQQIFGEESVHNTIDRSQFARCNGCGIIFVKKEFLEDHQRKTRHRPEPYSCEICKTQIQNENDVEAHKRAKHSFCETCGEFFAFEQQRDVHCKVTGHCYCRECERAFERCEELEEHMRGVHEKEGDDGGGKDPLSEEEDLRRPMSELWDKVFSLASVLPSHLQNDGCARSSADDGQGIPLRSRASSTSRDGGVRLPPVIAWYEENEASIASTSTTDLPSIFTPSRSGQASSVTSDGISPERIEDEDDQCKTNGGSLAIPPSKTRSRASSDGSDGGVRLPQLEDNVKDSGLESIADEDGGVLLPQLES